MPSSASCCIYTLSLHDALPIFAASRPLPQPDHRHSGLPRPACAVAVSPPLQRSEEHTSELQSLRHLVCRLLQAAASTLFPYTTLFRSLQHLDLYHNQITAIPDSLAQLAQLQSLRLS